MNDVVTHYIDNEINMRKCHYTKIVQRTLFNNKKDTENKL